jgi:hypothetical protein
MKAIEDQSFGKERPTRSGGKRLFVDSRAKTRRAGLSFFCAISMEHWLAIGHELVAISDASAWWLGDWLVYGERKFPERYRVAISSTNLSYKTLRNYAWVARKFPVSRRREELALAHHAEVAPLPEEDQEFWLDQAVARGWSVAELRRRLKVARTRAVGERFAERVEIAVDAERKRRWQNAADSIGRDLSEWACSVIDRAAGIEVPSRRVS